MRHVSTVFLLLVVLSLLCCSVFAIEPGVDIPEAESTLPLEEPSSPAVVIDPQSISDLVGAFVDSWNTRDALDATEPSVPVVDISSDSVKSIAEAVGQALTDSQAAEAASGSAGGVSGGYYFVADCALGRSIKFWIPADFASGALALDNAGIINMTNSSIYLMPDSSSFSNYTIYANRFGHFQYRRNSAAYDYQDLAITNISATNIDFLDSTPQAVPDFIFWVVLISIVALGFLLMIFVKR